jgi:hypothetical protein
MEMCYKILGEGKLVHQRELFYKLLSDSPKYFSCQSHVNRAIQGNRIFPTPFGSCLTNMYHDPKQILYLLLMQM